MFRHPVFIRIFSFIILSLLWYFGMFIVAVPLTVWYVYTFRAYEIIFLGIVIDAYFLSTVATPYYTLGFLGGFIFMELLKPSLRKTDVV